MDFGAIVVSRYGLVLTEPDENGWMQGCCPFHEDTHPSFGFNSISGAYNCFACGHGNFAAFVEQMGDNLQDVLASVTMDTECLRDDIARRFSRKELIETLHTTDVVLSKWVFNNPKRLPYEKTEAILQRFDWLKANHPEDAVTYVESVFKSN